MITVNVTAGHIAKGKREDCEHCPVALAILDAIPDLTYVAVGPEELTLGPIDNEVRVEVPAVVLEFIRDFDDGGTPAPFAFDLLYPGEVAA